MRNEATPDWRPGLVGSDEGGVQARRGGQVHQMAERRERLDQFELLWLLFPTPTPAVTPCQWMAIAEPDGHDLSRRRQELQGLEQVGHVDVSFAARSARQSHRSRQETSDEAPGVVGGIPCE